MELVNSGNLQKKSEEHFLKGFSSLCKCGYMHGLLLFYIGNGGISICLDWAIGYCHHRFRKLYTVYSKSSSPLTSVLRRKDYIRSIHSFSCYLMRLRIRFFRWWIFLRSTKLFRNLSFRHLMNVKILNAFIIEIAVSDSVVSWYIFCFCKAL